MGKAGKIVRLVRVMRIMRIFKLVRHFAGLQSLIYTLNQAYKELGLLMLLVGVAVLTFSSLVYFAEKDNPKGAWSFLDSFWWGLMTLTTVGYGDLSPSTFPGKLIGKVAWFWRLWPTRLKVNSVLDREAMLSISNHNINFSNLSKSFQIFPNLFKSLQIYSNHFKFIKLSKPLKLCNS